MALYMLISGVGSLLASQFAVAADHAVYLPANPAWWVAFMLGGPLCALFVGTLCTIVSCLSHDVRTAQQGVWFVVFFATLICGTALTNGLASGVGTVAVGSGLSKKAVTKSRALSPASANPETKSTEQHALDWFTRVARAAECSAPRATAGWPAPPEDVA